MAERRISAEDRAKAQRLHALWDLRKKRLGLNESDRTYILLDHLTDERVEIPENDVIEFGVKIGVLEQEVAKRTPWRI